LDEEDSKLKQHLLEKLECEVKIEISLNIIW
jgi:hypothetical protein